MVQLNEYRVRWEGLPGMPGVSTFYGSGTDPSLLKAKLFQWAEALKICIPGGAKIIVPAVGRVIESDTGQAVGTWATGSETTSPGGGTASYVAPAGVMIRWDTALFTNGRRLTGKTFVVPITADQYSNDGSPGSSILGLIQGAANALPGGTSPLVVYSRAHRSFGTVTAGTAVDKTVVLRSRRD